MIISRRQPIGQQGFSLLEILIAFSILALSLGILLKIFSAGVNTAVVAEEYSAAVQIAESVIAKTGLETRLQPGESSGVENDKYKWWVSVQPFITGLSTADPKTITTSLFKIKVIVSWGGDSEDDRQIELVSLRIVNSEEL
ncbi:MAG: prepilin-type N-terminal cleavage/methylation domain-containing protein [Methylococcales bacterium]